MAEDSYIINNDDPDWRSHVGSEGEVIVIQVSQNNLDQAYGILDGVILDNLSVTGSYDSDTRTSGSLTYKGDDWIRGAFLRIEYDVEKYEYRRTIGTYVAVEDPATYKKGYVSTKLKLQSAGLYTLSTEILPQPWSLSQGASVRTAMHQILNNSNRPYRDTATNDTYVSDAIVLEDGKSVLEWLYALSAIANVRIDTDGEGYVTIKNYEDPNNISASYLINFLDSRGMAQDGLTRTTDYLSIPGRAVVTYKYTTTEDGTSLEHLITGTADVESGFASPASRGYVITDYHSESDMSPATNERATQLARQYLTENTAENVEWELTTIYFPIWEGDVVDLYIETGPPRYQGIRHCIVKSIDINFGDMTMGLTLRET